MLREIVEAARMKPADFKDKIKASVGDKTFDKLSSEDWDKLFKSIPLNKNTLKGVINDDPSDYED